MNEAENPPLGASGERGEWTWPRRLVFRFLFIFLAFVFLPLPFGAVPGTSLVANTYHTLWQQVTPWVGREILKLAEPVAVGVTGSGDMTHNWIMLLCQLALAAAGAVTWSLLDRRPQIHPWWVDGLNVYLRYGLAFVMFSYGVAKVFPGQFPPVTSDQLITPLGRFSPMGLLWVFMGASQGYTFFGGAAEIAGGLLLLFRRTTLLGALVCAAVLANILALNLFYDVPVKLYSAELLATAIFLILPDLRRLASLLVLNRTAPARDLSMPSSSRRFLIATRVAKVALLAGWAFSLDYGSRVPAAAEKPPLYGLYEVEAFAIDGQPAQNDQERWRRVLFNERRRFVAQKMDDRTVRMTVRSVDEAVGKIELVGRAEGDKRTLTFERVDGVLVLRGRLTDHDFEARLRRVEDPKFELTSRGFRWISEAPYNRF